MVRRHGWQYPAHSYQVIAITLFFSLAAIFYVFLSPFLGQTIKEYVALGVFSPVALAVSLLYIRCTAIDPSDPGVLAPHVPRAPIRRTERSFTSNYSHIVADKVVLQSNSRTGIEGGRMYGAKKLYLSFLGLFGMLHSIIEGDECRTDGASGEPISQEDLLYCTICDTEVYKFSKHCRSCDKCVEGFDHHCRWLNNCIGRKNYVSFVALTAATLVMLFVETVSGMIVLVRCFTDKHEIRTHLTNKLGNGLSISPFSALVALCTLAPLFTSIPLGELFLFHMLLIRKGITTYEYVIAMRTQNGPHASARVQKRDIRIQPDGSSARNWRYLNSIALPHHAVWCNPRRVEQGEGTLHLEKRKLPCTVDTESTTVIERTSYKPNRQVIKISALKLAMLNPKEAAKAATKARENSSTFRPVGSPFHTSDKDCGFSCNITPRSSISGPASGRKVSSAETGNSPMEASFSPRQEVKKEERDMDMVSNQSRSPHSMPLSPLSMERRFGNPNVFRTSVDCLQVKEQGAAGNGLQVCNTTIIPHPLVEHPSWICTTPINEGHEISRGSETVQLGRSHIISVGTHANGEECGGNRTAVYWDRAAGKFRSACISSPGTKVSNLPPKAFLGDPCDLSGPNSILSPGRYLVHPKSALLQRPLNPSGHKNGGKENKLKVSSTHLRPLSNHNHIVLPSQSTTNSVCQSSISACRTKPKNMLS